MSNGALFLIDTLFNLYIMVVILRLWMQLARVDYFNPVCRNLLLKSRAQSLTLCGKSFRLLVVFDIAAAFLVLALSALKIYLIMYMRLNGFSVLCARVIYRVN